MHDSAKSDASSGDCPSVRSGGCYPSDGRSSSQLTANSSSSPSARVTSSGSSDDSMSSVGRHKLTLYEANMARQLLALKEGVSADVITPRKQRQFIEDTRKDAAYWERRKKNNEAAKRSREKRRINDMAMESQIQKIQSEFDQLRNELVTIKRHYGLDPGKSFLDQVAGPQGGPTEPMIPVVDESPSIPLSVLSDTESPGRLPSLPSLPSLHSLPDLSKDMPELPPPGHHHLPMVLNAHGRVMLMPRLFRPSYRDIRDMHGVHAPRHHQAILHPAGAMPVLPPPHPEEVVISQQPIPGLVGKDESWPPCPPPMDNSAELAYRQDDQLIERSQEYRSTEDSYRSDDGNCSAPSHCSGPSHCSAHHSGGSTRGDEQETPLNLVVNADPAAKPAKETSAECCVRMVVEAKRRYDEIKEGRVDNVAEGVRDQGVVSPGSSTTSTSCGSPYPKRLKMDESDSVMEAESISTGSENTSPGPLSPRAAALDNKVAERRKRNNEASRRSRETRKHITKTREEKTDVLEFENSKLRQELNTLASEVSNLKQMIVAKQNSVETCEESAQVE